MKIEIGRQNPAAWNVVRYDDYVNIWNGHTLILATNVEVATALAAKLLAALPAEARAAVDEGSE